MNQQSMLIMFSGDFLKVLSLPWEGGSVAWSIVSCVKRLQVRFLVKVPTGGNQLMLSRSLSVPPPLLPLSPNISTHILR